MKQTFSYSDYKAILNEFISLAKEEFKDELVLVVLFGSVARGIAHLNNTKVIKI